MKLQTLKKRINWKMIIIAIIDILFWSWVIVSWIDILHHNALGDNSGVFWHYNFFTLLAGR